MIIGARGCAAGVGVIMNPIAFDSSTLSLGTESRANERLEFIAPGAPRRDSSIADAALQL
jgi:hypothetical protein